MSYLKMFNFISCVIILSITFDVAHSRFVYRPDIQREIKQDKVIATWQEAKEYCESQGAILASPIDAAHLNYMRSIIEVNDHTSAYFTGYKAVIHDDDVNYISVEGILLDELPEVVINMIEKIDPEDGDCLSIDHREIRAVSCWERLPYICYTKVTNFTLHETMEVSSIVPVDMTSDVSIEISSSEPSEEYIEMVETVVTSTATSFLPVYEDDLIRRTFFISEENQTSTEFPGLPIENTDAKIDVRMNNADEGKESSSVPIFFINGRLYKLHTVPLPWTNANDTCAREGGHLAVINNDAELRVILEIGDVEPHVLWTGLKKEHGHWRSVLHDNIEDIYNRWSVNRADETCAVIIDTGLLDDRICDYPFPFICELPVAPTLTDAEA